MNRRALFAVLPLMAVLSAAEPAIAQTPDDYPNRPIRIIVPQAAGSGWTFRRVFWRRRWTSFGASRALLRCPGGQRHCWHGRRGQSENPTVTRSFMPR